MPPPSHELILEGGFFPSGKPLRAWNPEVFLTWGDGGWENQCGEKALVEGLPPFEGLETLLRSFATRTTEGYFQGMAFLFLGYGLRHQVERVASAASPTSFPDLAVAIYPQSNLQPFDPPGEDSQKTIGLGTLSFPDKAAFKAGVVKIQEHIAAGDIYQANLTHPFYAPFSGDSKALYLALRGQRPPLMGLYFDAGQFQVASTSPESFVRWEGRGIVTRPIKGTRPRGRTLAEDEALASELWHSAKDRAELAMIVDLMRNDLGRVCTYGSVHVENPCRLETFPTVHHLEGIVRGRLREEFGIIDWLKPLFPGGSITGAPKIRAMGIIAGLEPRERGFYTGCAGWCDFRGNGHLNILIRTAFVQEGNLEYWTGGGITIGSDPEEEYQETVTKAAPLLGVVKRHL